MKPTLKKVSKYENKFAKLQKKAAEFNFRNQLKVVKKKEFTLDEEEKEVRKDQSPSIRILFTNSYLSFLLSPPTLVLAEEAGLVKGQARWR